VNAHKREAKRVDLMGDIWPCRTEVHTANTVHVETNYDEVVYVVYVLLFFLSQNNVVTKELDRLIIIIIILANDDVLVSACE